MTMENWKIIANAIIAFGAILSLIISTVVYIWAMFHGNWGLATFFLVFAFYSDYLSDKARKYLESVK